MGQEVAPAVQSVGGTWRRGFWSLIATQFQGAFNENGLKNLVIFIIIGMGLNQLERDRLVLVAEPCFLCLSSYFRWRAATWPTATANGV